MDWEDRYTEPAEPPSISSPRNGIPVVVTAIATLLVPTCTARGAVEFVDIPGVVSGCMLTAPATSARGPTPLMVADSAQFTICWPPSAAVWVGVHARSHCPGVGDVRVGMVLGMVLR